MLWDAVAIEAARREDWPQVEALIALAASLHLPPTPTLRELGYMQARLRRYSS